MVVVVSGRLIPCRCVVLRRRTLIILFRVMMIRLVICGRCVVSIMRGSRRVRGMWRWLV
nr:MAG TPA: hypothetical protein [Caudoviricetes sp.]